MLNKFCKKPLYEVTRTLARVAMGVEKADTVILNARLVNVCTGEIQEGMDVAISEGRIALVGDAAHCIGENTRIIDGTDQYIAPGFMDCGIRHADSGRIRTCRCATWHHGHFHGSPRDLQRMRAGRRKIYD